MINFEEMVVWYPDAEARNAAWYSELNRHQAMNFKYEAEAE
jgi:hypothetical protein